MKNDQLTSRNFLGCTNMGKSQSALVKWLDSDFWKEGAFLTSSDGDTIVFGKGGKTSRVSKFLKTSKPVFYLKDFYTGSYLAYEPATILECTRSEIDEYLETLKLPKIKFSPIENDEDLYEKDFSLLKSAFSEKLQKVVLISRETYEAFEGEATIKHLLMKAFTFGTGLPYGFWDKKFGIIGSTPELLFNIDMDLLETYALAGTAKLGSEKELLASKKDRHEHNLVIKDIKEKLQDFAEDIEVGETHIHPYKSLVHLRTDIEATVEEDVDLTSLTNTFSPTAALGGYPKENSLKFLQGTHYAQKYPSRVFGSAFGLVSEDVKEFVVAIRNIQWENSRLFIECGGGIVSESLYQNELDEVHLKRETIRKHYL